MKKISVLIVDDHPMMREALRNTVAEDPEMTVIGEATDGEQAITLAQKHQPSIVLMDLLLPGLSGLEATRRILEAVPATNVLVVSALEDEEKILAAIQAGALGYFPKSAPPAFLLEGIRKVADGIPYLPWGITLKLFSGLRKIKIPTSAGASDSLLTGRQEEILALLAEGRSDEEISKMLYLSEATVRSHVHGIIQRLGVENRVQAVAHSHNRRPPLNKP